MEFCMHPNFLINMQVECMGMHSAPGHKCELSMNKG